MSKLKQTAGKTTGQGVNEEMTPSPYEDTLARRWERRRLALSVLAVLAGVILAFWLGRALTGRERNFAKAEFKISASGWTDSLQRIVADRVGRVSTTVAFIRGSDINDRKDFHTFVSQLTKNVPSIEVLAWAPRIPAARRNAHEEAVRKEEGLSKYVISQRDARGWLIAAGKREEYYPILFAEPASESESLLGIDLGSDAVSRAAMRQATASGLTTVAVYTAFSGDKSGDNLLFVLEPARYESVATHLAKRPTDQPETDGFVLGVLRMEAIAKRWLSLPGSNIPHGIDVYISANGKNLVALRTGAPPGPIPALRRHR